MVDEIERAFLASVQMLVDGIEKISDVKWREGSDAYFVPVRIAYHIFLGLEWLVTKLPPEEHLKHCRYQLDWLGPVDEMPGRQTMLEDLAWITGRMREWFAEWAQIVEAGSDTTARMEVALYFLRHTQHHLGEFSAAARLMQIDRPAWPFLKRTPVSVLNKYSKSNG